MDIELADILGAGVVGCLVSFFATRVVVGGAHRLHILDRPEGYKAHARATPLLGGLGVATGTTAGVGWLLSTGSVAHVAGLSALAIGSLIILIAGLLDDMRGLSPQHKFIWQLAAAGAAGLCLALLGVQLNLFLAWPRPTIILLTALWIVGITNAVNFLDNMNGLCAGVGAVAALSLALVNLRSGEITVAIVAAALGGACLGFLPHNWPHARIFLGDTGSMLIGFLLAALSVMGVYTRGAHVPILAVFTPLFVLGIPVLDSVLVIILRLHAGHPPWVGDRRHISHRLVHRGMNPAAAVATLWAACGACGLAALLLPTVGPSEAPLLFALLVCALGALAAAAGTRGLS
jgi:UDP-GlcNAc:undecaprenyl-phosphate/decaprenyl-phosphate GlcNAc-1-phosphate transferase